MRRHAVPFGVLVVLVLCCGFTASSNAAAVLLSDRLEKQGSNLDGMPAAAQLPAVDPPFFANEKASAAKGVVLQRQQQRLGQQIERVAATAVGGAAVGRVREDAKELRSVPAAVSAAVGPSQRKTASVLAAAATTTTITTAEDDADTTSSAATVSSAASDDATAAEKYGSILSGGVIASVTVALVFACFLLVLVLIEVGTNISDLVEHRRMVAYRESKGGDDPAEPKFGDFRDTVVNVQV